MASPFVGRQWVTTWQVVNATRMGRIPVKKRLNRLHRAGVVERTQRGDGAVLWRLAPEYADLVSRGAKR